MAARIGLKRNDPGMEIGSVTRFELRDTESNGGIHYVP